MMLDKNKLYLELANKCITIQQLSTNAEISKQTLYRGLKTPIKPVSIGRIAKALGVNPEDIIKS